ncbi:SMEK domain-containing protein [Pseudomonas sp. MIS38]|uniref:SMEK domain-containing protein n=1 Tax=Pseudomonas sp. MIS38 TaxID=91465 RepID=UPI001CA6CCCF|nr:SMEK domain-containing protein [Pseudomonas sp. MIS38]MBY8958282.1 SMEK domain-containing protein [Pseudomonas sp. MIS38]
MSIDGVVPLWIVGVSLKKPSCRVIGMTTHTQKKLDEIERKFIEIATHVKFQNKKGRTDINDDMERFFKQVLNAYHGYDLRTTNEKISTFPAIDLRDLGNRICYQITSTNRTTKIKSTIDTFVSNDMFNEYDNLVFLILTDQPVCKVPESLSNQMKNTTVSIMSITDLDFQISRIHDEYKINKIHSLAMLEYAPPSGSRSYVIKAPAKSNFLSMQRLIDQSGYDPKENKDEIKTYVRDFTEFVEMLEGLDVQQRLTLHRLVMKSELRPKHHDWLYYRKKRSVFDFKEDKEALESLEGQYFDYDWHFEIDDEGGFPAICLKRMTKLDLNIFEEIRKIAKYDEDLVREMIVSLDFKCVAL